MSVDWMWELSAVTVTAIAAVAILRRPRVDGRGDRGQPWASTPLMQRALVWEAAGRLRAADTDLVRAFERARSLRPLGREADVAG